MPGSYRSCRLVRLAYRFEAPGTNKETDPHLLRAVPPARRDHLLGVRMSSQFFGQPGDLVMNADGSGQRNLTRNSAPDRFPGLVA